MPSDDLLVWNKTWQQSGTFSARQGLFDPVFFCVLSRDRLWCFVAASSPSFRQFDGMSLLLLVKKELSRANLELAAVQFVACVEPLDSAAPSAAATLWVMRGDQGLVIATQGKNG